jgi:hypothetical protein
MCTHDEIGDEAMFDRNVLNKLVVILDEPKQITAINF